MYNLNFFYVGTVLYYLSEAPQTSLHYNIMHSVSFYIDSLYGHRQVMHDLSIVSVTNIFRLLELFSELFSLCHA